MTGVYSKQRNEERGVGIKPGEHVHIYFDCAVVHFILSATKFKGGLLVVNKRNETCMQYIYTNCSSQWDVDIKKGTEAGLNGEIIVMRRSWAECTKRAEIMSVVTPAAQGHVVSSMSQPVAGCW